MENNFIMSGLLNAKPALAKEKIIRDDKVKVRRKYKAMVRVMSGSAWGTSSTKGGAMKELKKELKNTWSHLFDVNAWLKAGNATCDIYQDSGTKDHGDDKYIETVPLI